jgi:hypothetical protein
MLVYKFERRKTMINLYLLYVHAKFMKLGMRASHVISDLFVKWHIQLLLILAVIPFLSLAMLEF